MARTFSEDRGDLAHFKVEVRPIETADDLLGAPSMPSCFRISTRTAGVAVAVNATIGGIPKIRNRPPEAQVVGTEVMAPQRNAVRLVNRKQAHLQLANSSS